LSANLPPLPTNVTFSLSDQFQYLVFFDSGSGSDRLVLIGKRELIDVLARIKERVHCFFLMQVVMNKSFLLNPEKKIGANPSCRFRDKRTFNSKK